MVVGTALCCVVLQYDKTEQFLVTKREQTKEGRSSERTNSRWLLFLVCRLL